MLSCSHDIDVLRAIDLLRLFRQVVKKMSMHVGMSGSRRHVSVLPRHVPSRRRERVHGQTFGMSIVSQIKFL